LHGQDDTTRSKKLAVARKKTFQFKERSAVIHRSMVEKMSETEGYGVIENDAGQCLTVFELDAGDDNQPQPPKLKFWSCAPGWTDQMFIYPACGLGPGQLRWAKDPAQCVHRQTGSKKGIVLKECDWRHAFIFDITLDSDDPDTGVLKVGTERKYADDIDEAVVPKTAVEI